MSDSNVLLLGMSGGLASIVAQLWNQAHPNDTIVGVDSRSLKHVSPHSWLQTKKIRYTPTSFESLFRNHRFHTVFHLARLSHSKFNHQSHLGKRLNMGIVGTQKIIDLCLQHKVKRLVLLSTFHVYGALADNPPMLGEDSPLRAVMKYPELVDVVDMDQVAQTALWRYNGVLDIVVLRAANILGPQIQNTLGNYLRMKLRFSPIDFNPRFQFVHEFDIARALVAAAKQLKPGVYNVAPNDHVAIQDVVLRPPGVVLPVSMAFSSSIAKLGKSFIKGLPNYLLDYFKYSCTIDPQRFLDQVGADFFRFSSEEVIEDLIMQDLS